ncbi:MAG: hypothetical protein LBQ66_00120 [Planctomycetaceae bacterium]|jgi:ABC-type bacteriocin/lantibiotic exporter with double-glycine peptidase domain|nr:hypothetical protein [Planctomycetaceae bacterium]
MSILLLIFGEGVAFCADDNTAEHTDKTYSTDDIIEQSNILIEHRAVCGPLALTHCIAITGTPVPFRTINDLFITKTERGVKLSELIKHTRSYYPDAKAIIAKDKKLKNLPRPAIIILKEKEHCIVYEDFDAATSRFRIWDPATLGVVEYTADELNKLWGGEIIILQSHGKITFWIMSAMLIVGLSLIVYVVFCEYQTIRKQSITFHCLPVNED